jgi:hypothetical protein
MAKLFSLILGSYSNDNKDYCFWDVHNLVDVTDISEEYAPSIFKIEAWKK